MPKFWKHHRTCFSLVPLDTVGSVFASTLLQELKGAALCLHVVEFILTCWRRKMPTSTAKNGTWKMATRRAAAKDPSCLVEEGWLIFAKSNMQMMLTCFLHQWRKSFHFSESPKRSAFRSALRTLRWVLIHPKISKSTIFLCNTFIWFETAAIAAVKLTMFHWLKC